MQYSNVRAFLTSAHEVGQFFSFYSTKLNVIDLQFVPVPIPLDCQELIFKDGQGVYLFIPLSFFDQADATIVCSNKKGCIPCNFFTLAT